MKKTITTISLCLLMPTIALSMNNETGAPRKGISRLSPLPFKPIVTANADEEKQNEVRSKVVVSVPLSLASSLLEQHHKQRSLSGHSSKSSSSENDFSGNAEQPREQQPEEAEINGHHDELPFLRNQNELCKRIIVEQRQIIAQLGHEKSVLGYGLAMLMRRIEEQERQQALTMRTEMAALQRLMQQMAIPPAPSYYDQLEQRAHENPYLPRHQ